jgi:glycosyltransferase involved in cell wall biosynthesis
MIVPSLCYEGFPRVIVEAFACGTPVIASEIGGMAETVRHGKTGLLFHPGDAKALAQACMMVKENATLAAELGGNARDIYESFYTPEKNYHQLMNIYRNAMNGSGE